MKKLLKEISKLKVAVIGDVILDRYIWGRATRISPEAPVPIVDVEKDAWFAGGAANVAMDVAGLGASASLFGSTGSDEANAALSNMLLDEDIDFTRFPASQNAPTVVKTRVAAQGQQMIRIDRNSAPQNYAPSVGYITAMLDSIRGADAVIVSDYARGFLDDNILRSIIDSVRSYKKFVAVDPKPRRRLNFSGPNLITANRAEAFALAEMFDDSSSELPIRALAESIYARYSPDFLVVTLGAEGMYVCRKAKPLKHIPTDARDVFDPAGAGDAVTSALALALAAGEDIERAAAFANTAAGVVVGKMGSMTVSAGEMLAY